MTTRVVARGSEWSESTLHDGWGDDVTDEQITELGKLVVSRFEKLAENDGYAVNWFPSLSEVLGDVELVDVYDDMDVYILDDIREQAANEVWEAVTGNGGPMEKAVNEIFQEVA